MECSLGELYGHDIWNATLDTSGLKLRDGRMTGRLTATVSDVCGKFGSGEYSWDIDAVVIGRRVLGTGTGTCGGRRSMERLKALGRQNYPVSINGLIADTTSLPDVKKWQLDYDERVKEATARAMRETAQKAKTQP